MKVFEVRNSNSPPTPIFSNMLFLYTCFRIRVNTLNALNYMKKKHFRMCTWRFAALPLNLLRDDFALLAHGSGKSRIFFVWEWQNSTTWSSILRRCPLVGNDLSIDASHTIASQAEVLDHNFPIVSIHSSHIDPWVVPEVSAHTLLMFLAKADFPGQVIRKLNHLRHLKIKTKTTSTRNTKRKAMYVIDFKLSALGHVKLAQSRKT